jgi:Protein of unknown function (DUF3455)
MTRNLLLANDGRPTPEGPDKQPAMRDNGLPRISAEVISMRALPVFVIALLLPVATCQQPSTSIDPPAGEHLLLQLQATGVQIYSCTSDNGATAWKLKGPDAKLRDAKGADAGTHFAGPTWKLADGSEVKASPVANKPAPESGAVAWLLLKVASHSGSGKLDQAAYVTRTNTKGGVAPPSGCDAEHQGQETRVPYSATYSFYGH